MITEDMTCLKFQHLEPGLLFALEKSFLPRPMGLLIVSQSWALSAAGGSQTRSDTPDSVVISMECIIDEYLHP